MTALENVENYWLDKLYQFSKQLFSQVDIPSHDHDHHLRVWHTAKELIEDLEELGHDFTPAKIEEVITACMLHDIGMIETVDKKHGHVSRIISEKYFQESPLQFGGDLETILSAIEHHDDKAYKNMVYGGSSQTNVLSILCVCDDLDAFGAVGVFRYLEIYLLRNKTVPQIADIVLENIESRFANFEKLYGNLSHLYEHQKERFEFIKKFYQQLQSKEPIAINIAEQLISEVINRKQSLATYTEKVLKDPATTQELKEFFELIEIS